MQAVIDVFGMRWILLASALGLSFLVAARVPRLRRGLLVAAMMTMVGTTIFSAAYVVAYEQSYQQPAYADAQGENRKNALRGAGTSVRRDAHGYAGADGRQKKRDEQSADGAALAATLEGNAIMRASLHVQVATAVGGLFAAGMGIVAAFIAVLSVLDAQSRGGAVPEAGMQASHDGDCNARRERKSKSEPVHFTTFEKFITILLVLRDGRRLASGLRLEADPVMDAQSEAPEKRS